MKFQITVQGQEIALPCEAGESVLEAVERAGFAVPYSCRKGVCATCECDLVGGSVAVGRRATHEGAQPNLRICVATPTSDIVIAPRSIARATPQHRKRMTASVYRIDRPAPDVSVLRLRLPIGRRLPFRAGQYVRVHFGDGQTRNYSLANDPRDNGQLTLHIRHVPGGLFSGALLAKLKPGDLLDVEGPFGQFAPAGPGDAPLLMLATGTGYAPLRSVISDLVQKRNRRRVHLFWGARTTADLYDEHSLQRLAQQNAWFRYTPVLTTPEADWTGRTGFVQTAALDQYPDCSGMEVLACGNPSMIDQARSLLQARAGMSPHAFTADAFVPSGDSNTTQ